jgi:hypothetical protein
VWPHSRQEGKRFSAVLTRSKVRGSQFRKGGVYDFHVVRLANSNRLPSSSSMQRAADQPAAFLLKWDGKVSSRDTQTTIALRFLFIA